VAEAKGPADEARRARPEAAQGRAARFVKSKGRRGDHQVPPQSIRAIGRKGNGYFTGRFEAQQRGSQRKPTGAASLKAKGAEG